MLGSSFLSFLLQALGKQCWGHGNHHAWSVERKCKTNVLVICPVIKDALFQPSYQLATAESPPALDFSAPQKWADQPASKDSERCCRVLPPFSRWRLTNITRGDGVVFEKKFDPMRYAMVSHLADSGVCCQFLAKFCKKRGLHQASCLIDLEPRSG
jgi:hypothetical protein